MARLLCSMIALLVAGPTLWAAETVRVVAEQVEVRGEASAGGNVLGTAKRGTVFQVLDREGGWVQVAYPIGNGAFYNGYIPAVFCEDAHGAGPSAARPVAPAPPVSPAPAPIAAPLPVAPTPQPVAPVAPTPQTYTPQAPRGRAPPEQASRPRLTAEKVRGYLGGFGGISTAQADGLESGTVFGGSGAFYFHRNVGVEVAFQRRRQDVVGTSSNALSGGSLNSNIFTGSVLVRFPLNSRVAPYFVGGVAQFSNTFEIAPAISSSLSAAHFRATEEIANKVGFGVGGGLDAIVAGRFALFGEMRYLAASSDTKAELADTVTGTAAGDSGRQDLKGLEIRAGVRLVF